MPPAGLHVRTSLPTGSVSWVAERVQEIGTILSGEHVASRWAHSDADTGCGVIYASRAFRSQAMPSMTVRIGRASREMSLGDQMVAITLRNGVQAFSLQWDAPEAGAARAARTGIIEARSVLPALTRMRDLLRQAVRAPSAEPGPIARFESLATIAASVAPEGASLHMFRPSGPWSRAGGLCYDRDWRRHELTDAAIETIDRACGRIVSIEYHDGRYAVVAPQAANDGQSISPVDAIRAARATGDHGTHWWTVAPESRQERSAR